MSTAHWSSKPATEFVFSHWTRDDTDEPAAKALADKFVKNLRKFKVDDDVTNAGPQLN
ncbi:MAG: hypothetical protein HN526_03300 [Gammaproteobacteria bacterium]|nr:hypothetical protein [Gammaproteobacteria bacterium]